MVVACTTDVVVRVIDAETAVFMARIDLLLDQHATRHALTHTERAVYRLTILAYAPQDAADNLGIALLTLRRHSSNAARKLGYATLLEAALHFLLELADAPLALRRRTRSGTMRRP